MKTNKKFMLALLVTAFICLPQGLQAQDDNVLLHREIKEVIKKTSQVVISKLISTTNQAIRNVIIGKVSDEAGEFVSDPEIQVNNVLTKAPVTPWGRYKLQNLPEGKHRICINAPAYKSDCFTIDVQDGHAYEVESYLLMDVKFFFPENDSTDVLAL